MLRDSEAFPRTAQTSPPTSTSTFQQFCSNLPCDPSDLDERSQCAAGSAQDTGLQPLRSGHLFFGP